MLAVDSVRENLKALTHLVRAYPQSPHLVDIQSMQIEAELFDLYLSSTLMINITFVCCIFITA